MAPRSETLLRRRFAPCGTCGCALSLRGSAGCNCLAPDALTRAGVRKVPEHRHCSPLAAPLGEWRTIFFERRTIFFERRACPWDPRLGSENIVLHSPSGEQSRAASWRRRRREWPHRGGSQRREPQKNFFQTFKKYFSHEIGVFLTGVHHICNKTMKQLNN